MTYEVVLDNARLLVNCFEESPPEIEILVANTPTKNAFISGVTPPIGSSWQTTNPVLSDDSDSTYADQWLSIVGGVPNGPTLRAIYSPMSGVGPPDVRMRFEIANESGAPSQYLYVFLLNDLTASEIGYWTRGIPVGANTSVPLLDTIYDWTDWTWNQTGAEGSLEQGFDDGIRLSTRRTSPGGENGEYLLRVYELQLIA